jgi:hypothetical protein
MLKIRNRSLKIILAPCGWNFEILLLIYKQNNISYVVYNQMHHPGPCITHQDHHYVDQIPLFANVIGYYIKFATISTYMFLSPEHLHIIQISANGKAPLTSTSI